MKRLGICSGLRSPIRFKVQPVERLIFVGDTRGNEAGTRTKVDIFFREFRIEVEESRTD